MSEEYANPAFAPIAFDFENSKLNSDQNGIVFSGKDVLGIVQAAFDEIGPLDGAMIAIKREVLAEVAAGRLAHALRTAIVGAARCSSTGVT